MYCWQHLQNKEDKSLAKLREEHAEEVAELEKQHLQELTALRDELDRTSGQLKMLQSKDAIEKVGDQGKVDSSCQTIEFCVKSSLELGGVELKPELRTDLPEQLHLSSLTVFPTPPPLPPSPPRTFHPLSQG